jgi:uncharacterized membrane protein
MKSIIGVYNSHAKAIEAVKILQGEDISQKDISLIARTNIDEKNIDTKKENLFTEGPVAFGVVAGPILGVLTGIGIFAIPGLGFLYGAGALVGALAGLDFGLVGGGIISLLGTLGVGDKHRIKFQEYLKEGKVILIARSDEETLKKAKKILESYAGHHELFGRS